MLNIHCNNNNEFGIVKLGKSVTDISQGMAASCGT